MTTNLHLRDLVGAGLEGGTLVEYKDNCGFALEYGRATIRSVSIQGDEFAILTDSEDAYLKSRIDPELEQRGIRDYVERRGPYFLIRLWMAWCYVAAPKGVEVPNRPNWLDVTEDEFKETIRKAIGG